MDQSMASIAVFGEALVDDFGTEQVVGGAPFNVARNLAAFGVAPLMVTRIGADGNGALVSAEFDRFGMERAALQIDATAETGRVVVERGKDGHRFIILPDQAYDRIDAQAACSAVAAKAPSTIYFGTLAQRHGQSRGALEQILQGPGAAARRYLDLNVREGQVSERCVFFSLHQADIVKVNEDELQDLFGWYTHTRLAADMDSAPVRDACASLLRIFGLSGLIVTLGPRGAAYFGADGSVISSAGGAVPERIVDTVGAGDAFSAIFLLGLARGWPLALTLARANEFAAAICTIAGAVPKDNAFYAPWTARWLAD